MPGNGSEPLIKGESDYKKMGMGEANLFVAYTMFGIVLMIPGLVGTCTAFFILHAAQPLAKAKVLAENSLGPLYLSFYVLMVLVTQINANLGTARRATNVNVPDQHVYKVVGGPADGFPVLMDDTHELYGPFNRAQRALQNLNEIMANFVVTFLFAGFVFPWTTAFLSVMFGVFRVKGALDYKADRLKRMSGNTAAMICMNAMQAIMIVSGAYATYLELTEK